MPASESHEIKFLSGLVVPDAMERVAAFLADEYTWYDAFPDANPNSVTPFDVLAAAGINAFVGGASASRMRGIHAGMASHCDGLLVETPVNVDLTDDEGVELAIGLVLPALEVKYALAAVATKILHRKRRRLIPIMDKFIAENYVSERDARILQDSYASEERRRSAMTDVLTGIRHDVEGSKLELENIAQHFEGRGMKLSILRIHDILAWTQLEPEGYYRHL